MVMLDGSMMLAGLFPDEQSPRAASALACALAGPVHVPQLSAVEVANSIVFAERKGRVNGELSARMVRAIGELPVVVHPLPTPDAAHQLAWLSRLFDLTTHDAVYLDLALRLELPLATLDKALAAAGQRLGVAIL